MVHDKLFSKYSREIYTLNLWYNSCKCFGGPGLMESVSFRSCHRWCFCISTAVFAHLSPSCHGLGLCVCLRSLPVPGTGTEHCVMIPWWQIPCLSPEAQGNRSAGDFNVGLCFLEAINVLGQTFSPWAAALANCKEHVDLKMRWGKKKDKILISVSSPSGSPAVPQEKTVGVTTSENWSGRNHSSSEPSVSL